MALVLGHRVRRREARLAHSCMVPQMATDARRSISDPSSNTASQMRRAVDLGRHVANNVRNHCIVNTFVNGGS